MSLIPALGKLRQEKRSRPSWDTQQDLASKKTKQTKKTQNKGKKNLGWGYRSVVDTCLTKCEPLGSVTSTATIKKKKL
jgi:hypothetical protein